jgi:hypothetical protein
MRHLMIKLIFIFLAPEFLRIEAQSHHDKLIK